MPLYRMTHTAITPVPTTKFGAAGIRERADLQRLLREHLEVIAPDCLIIAEEFGSWDASYRRIDLLAVDRDANLVVIELKRDETGAHMELQALRYAAMVARMTFAQAASALEAYRSRKEVNGQGAGLVDTSDDARQTLLDFLEWDEADETHFGQDVRIVLVAADFSRELTTSVMWLNQRDIDIRCVQVQPYQLDGQLLLQVEQVIPLREASEYQVQVREKARQERIAKTWNNDLTRFDLRINGKTLRRLAKRRLVYAAVRHVIECLQKSPEELAAKVGNRRMWLSLDGELDAEGFRNALEHLGTARGRPIEPRRWMCEDGELLHIAGRTYAFTKGWGQNAIPAMEALRREYPEAGISYDASPEE